MINDEETIKKPRKRYTRKVPPPVVPNRQGYVSETPVNGQDLMAAWEIPSEAWEGVLLKIRKLQPGTQAYEIISETTIKAYSLRDVARQYGPGQYQLYLPNDVQGGWTYRSAVVRVSPEYARESGYSAIPASVPQPQPIAQSMASARALTETAEALHAGGQALTAAQLAQLIEGIVENVVRRVQPVAPVAPQGLSIDQAFSLFATMQQAQDRAIDRALELAGHAPEPEAQPESEWVGVARAVAPALGAIFERFAPQPQPQPQPAPALAPKEEIMQFSATEDQLAAVKPFANLIRPFIPQLLELLRGSAPIEELAQEVASYIPAPMLGGLKVLGDLVRQQGPAILALVDPRLATAARAAELVLALCEGAKYDE